MEHPPAQPAEPHARQPLLQHPPLLRHRPNTSPPSPTASPPPGCWSTTPTPSSPPASPATPPPRPTPGSCTTPEYWALTPRNEQQNPARYLPRFGQLAHTHALNVIPAPGRDLALVPGATCPQARGETLDHWYPRRDLPGAAAADLLVVQDQAHTTNTAEFDYLSTTTRTQAQAANPHITTDAEVSTTYGTASQMATAAKSAHADGIYINATTPTLGKTKTFLRLMQTAGY